MAPAAVKRGGVLVVADWFDDRTADPTTWVFQLRRWIKFHDGTELNAAAVKFHFDRHLDPNTKSPRNGELIAVDKAEVVDTVRVRLKTPYAAFLASLYDCFIVSPTAVQKWGNVQSGVHPVGTGPFTRRGLSSSARVAFISPNCCHFRTSIA